MNRPLFAQAQLCRMLADLPRNLFKIEPPYAEIKRSGKADPDEIGQQQKSGTWAYGVPAGL
jgi:hypothetical protein